MKSLTALGFYLKEFCDGVRCFDCARTVQGCIETDNPADKKWHKSNCAFMRGQDCDNIPIRSLFNIGGAQAGTSRQREMTLEQRDQSENLLRTVQYPADLSERIRQAVCMRISEPGTVENGAPPRQQRRGTSNPNNNLRGRMGSRMREVRSVMENSTLVRNVLSMGFDERIVQALLEDKIETGNVPNPDDIYHSVSSFLDDVMKKEEELKKEEERIAVVNGGATYWYSTTTRTSSLQSSPFSDRHSASDFDEIEAMDIDPYEDESSGCSQQRAHLAEQEVSRHHEEQLDRAEEERMCKICFSNPVEMVFVPCGHVCCCMQCTEEIERCPFCRGQLEKAVKYYMV